MSRNIRAARVTRVVIFIPFQSRTQTVATLSRLFRVTPLELNRHSRLNDRMSANALSARAWHARQNSGKVHRVTRSELEAPKAPSARDSNVYAQLSAFRRRSTRDATRRRASPASACVASPDAKTAKKPDTLAERNARTTVRKAVAVTTKREKVAHRVPRGVAGWCHRLLDHCDILILHDLTASSKGAWLSGCRLPSNFPAGVGQILISDQKDLWTHEYQKNNDDVICQRSISGRTLCYTIPILLCML